MSQPTVSGHGTHGEDCVVSLARLATSLRIDASAGRVPLGNIAELLAHKGLAMTKRYAHPSISNLHDTVSRIVNSTSAAPEPIRETQPESYVN
jgi:hypothetical protein